jgi:hypothetical protein
MIKKAGVRMTADNIFFWANWIGVVALGVGVVCACAIAISGKIRDDSLKLSLAEATAKTAIAELQLAQLRTLAGPRLIRMDAFLKELEGKPKAPVVIWYLPDVSDGYMFSMRLFGLLASAKWEAAFPIPIPDIDEKTAQSAFPGAEKLTSFLKGMPRAVIAGGQPSGVTVVGDASPPNTDIFDSDTPLRALFRALAASTNFGMYASSASQFAPVPKGTLRVVVAAKTDPLLIDPTNAPAAATPK